MAHRKLRPRPLLQAAVSSAPCGVILLANNDRISSQLSYESPVDRKGGRKRRQLKGDTKKSMGAVSVRARCIKYITTEERKSYLSRHKYAGEFSSQFVFCLPCNKNILLDKRREAEFYASNFEKHLLTQVCRRNQAQFDRVSTSVI